ncbi:hypothetical protein AVEN_69733-1 [Araneus ventricosus]|uniref:Uncharacterized protein n=1 Tax=Araneus ventricosus TaxID=182803 RepID=A0A4Y2V843_ARAVE|nr:hypothetical protein AVEN_69733-1 [Araneus ventricosus]
MQTLGYQMVIDFWCAVNASQAFCYEMCHRLCVVNVNIDLCCEMCYRLFLKKGEMCHRLKRDAAVRVVSCYLVNVAEDGILPHLLVLLLLVGLKVVIACSFVRQVSHHLAAGWEGP